jgi:F-box interacting protein
MSSSKLRPAASSSGVLSPDLLYEILLLLPAKDLCRFRAVCRAWRSLTSGPGFAALHKSRHKGPLLALAYDDNKGTGVDIVDLSGNVLRRIPSTEVNIEVGVSGHISNTENVISPTHLDLVCFARQYNSLGLWVLNPATGATIELPDCRSEELELELQGEDDIEVESCAFGQVSSTGEYKILRVTRFGGDTHGKQACEVITVDGTNHGTWRRAQSPPSPIGTSYHMKCVVLDDVVYFLIDFLTSFSDPAVMTEEPGRIALFDLETEEWWGSIPGPAPVLDFAEDSHDWGYIDLDQHLSLAKLSGFLVTVHNVHFLSMDLWFLTDVDNDIWVKKYSIPSQDVKPDLYPFLILDDERILFRDGKRFLKCDPRTGTYADALEGDYSGSVAIYTGNLLSID